MTGLIRSFPVWLLCSLPAGVLAAPPSGAAKAHYAKGIAAYRSQDWPTAIRELDLACQREKRPEYLFALAQSQRLSGDCESAIASYAAFLRVATSRQTANVEGLIKTCTKELAQAKGADAADAEEGADVERRPTAEEVREGGEVEEEVASAAVQRPAVPPRVSLSAAPGALRWDQDPLGDTLAVAAAAVVGVGATFLVLGNGAMSRAASTTTFGGYQSALSAAKGQQLVGLGAIAAGLLCGAGAIWRFGTIARGGPVVSAAPQAGGAVFSLSGSF